MIRWNMLQHPYTFDFQIFSTLLRFFGCLSFRRSLPTSQRFFFTQSRTWWGGNSTRLIISSSTWLYSTIGRYFLVCRRQHEIVCWHLNLASLLSQKLSISNVTQKIVENEITTIIDHTCSLVDCLFICECIYFYFKYISSISFFIHPKEIVSITTASNTNKKVECFSK